MGTRGPAPQPVELYAGIEDTIRMIDDFVNTICEYLESVRPQETKRDVMTPEESAALTYLYNKMDVFREADMAETGIIRAVLEEIGYILGASDDWKPWVAEVDIRCPGCNYRFRRDFEDPQEFLEVARSLKKELGGLCPRCGEPLENRSRVESRQYFAFPVDLRLATVRCRVCGAMRFYKLYSAEEENRLRTEVLRMACPSGHTELEVEVRRVRNPWELTQEDRANFGILYIPPGREVPPPRGVRRKRFKIYRVHAPNVILKIPRVSLAADLRERFRDLIERMLGNVENEAVLTTLAARLFSLIRSLPRIVREDRSRFLKTPPQVSISGRDALAFLQVGLRIWSAAEFQIRAYVRDLDLKAGHVFFPMLGLFKGAVIAFGRRVLNRWGPNVMMPYDEFRKMMFDMLAGANMIRELLRAIRAWIPDQQAILQFRRQQVAEAMRAFLTMMQGASGGGQFPFIPMTVPSPPASEEAERRRREEVLRRMEEELGRIRRRAEEEAGE